MKWLNILPDVWMFRDSCNVYAVRGPQGCLIIDSGTGYWLDAVHELPAAPVALACTHYFRDHAAGAARASQAGIGVYVPEYERAIFADPQQHFRQRETYIMYDNQWDLFAPIEAAMVSGVLRDHEKLSLAGLNVAVVPLPGVTLTQVGLEVVLATSGQKVIFCGEAIHSPGRLARIAPLQYNYNDLPGAVQCGFACEELLRRQPDVLLPSLGEPILDDSSGAVKQLQQNLRTLCSQRLGMNEAFDGIAPAPLQKITEHVYLDTQSVAQTWFLISDSGKAMAIDYGYFNPAEWPGYPRPYTRRPLLHGLESLKQQLGIDTVDVVLVSHFHDDHVCGIPQLQRIHGTQCWCPENFADLLEYPERHCFPCDWPVPCRIDRRLPLDQTFQWEEYTFRLHPMNGHTRFSALIGFEADGKRFAHTGDQYFFVDGVDDFANNTRLQNHVYRNGALLDGYDISGQWMLEWRPDIVITGHQPAMFTDEHFFRHIEAWAEDYKSWHQTAMVLGEAETHFNLDSWGGWIWPYRVHLAEPSTATVRVTVRNPFPRAASLEVRLVGPDGWQGSAATLQAEARAEVSCDLHVTPSGQCRRQPFAVELIADGQPFGQVAEALITVGSPEF